MRELILKILRKKYPTGQTIKSFAFEDIDNSELLAVFLRYAKIKDIEKEK